MGGKEGFSDSSLGGNKASVAMRSAPSTLSPLPFPTPFECVHREHDRDLSQCSFAELLRRAYASSAIQNCQPTLTSAVLTFNSRGQPSGSAGPGRLQSRLSKRRCRTEASRKKPLTDDTFA